MSKDEITIKLNFSTLILSLVLLIPLGYLVYANVIQKQPEAVAKTEEKATETPAVGNIQMAIDAATSATEKSPSYLTFLNLGLVYYQAGEYQKSVEATQKAIDFDPNQAVAYNNIAAAYGAMGKWDIEIAACEKALQLDPDFQLAKNNLAWAKSQLEKESNK
jgi:tetratricopeptide (TPR) repeat protein